MFERVGTDWVGSLLPPEKVIHMPEIGLEVPMAEFYEGISFPAPEPDEA